MMNAHELLKRRYLQALQDLIDRPGVDRRWIPCVVVGDEVDGFVEAAFHATMGVGRSMVALQLFADEDITVQHRVHVAQMIGRKQRIVRDCVLWAPGAAGRALIVPRSNRQAFHFGIGASGTVERHAGSPARDKLFGVALAAKRLREGAAAAVPDRDARVLSCTTLGGIG